MTDHTKTKKDLAKEMLCVAVKNYHTISRAVLLCEKHGVEKDEILKIIKEQS